MSFQKLGTDIRENCKNNIFFAKTKESWDRHKKKLQKQHIFLQNKGFLWQTLRKKSNNIIFLAKQRKPGTDIKTNCKSTYFFAKTKKNWDKHENRL